MRKSKLSQREAWLLMAEHWRADRLTEIGCVTGACFQTGLCFCATLLFNREVITPEVYRAISTRLGTLRMLDNGHCWPRTTRGAQARRRFCLRMARELAVTQATERMGSDGTVSEDSK